MIIQCAWCRKEFGEKPPYEDKSVTHSICKECKDKYFSKDEEKEDRLMIRDGKTYRIKGSSQYFLAKYGSTNPEIVIESRSDYHDHFSPPTFLFQGRALAESVPIDGNTYYGHIQGLGEFVHESELEEIG